MKAVRSIIIFAIKINAISRSNRWDASNDSTLSNLLQVNESKFKIWQSTQPGCLRWYQKPSKRDRKVFIIRHISIASWLTSFSILCIDAPSTFGSMMDRRNSQLWLGKELSMNSMLKSPIFIFSYRKTSDGHFWLICL
jgi:hypothetical protein